ncbi:CHAT domain-containing protein [Fulvivirgaceae bacterium BMA10]|uniref:CHAT domain-containing protein n=1 Tax=Splendidivirga corallicola TaxID=3051826 RepID=A0ABT8KJ10_9BACT|nr:CHAT domain-containing protein [Fulvivirgaceae bacterium BMA10]
MKLHGALVSLLSAFFLFTIYGRAQQIPAIIDQVQHLSLEYKYDSATSLLDNAINSSDIKDDPLKLLLLQNELAEVKIKQEHIREARKTLERALSVYSSKKLNKKDLLGRLQLNMAQVTSFERDRKKTTELLAMAIKNLNGQDSTNNFHLAKAHILNGHNSIRLAEFDLGRKQLDRGLTLLEVVDKINAPTVCNGYYGIGLFFDQVNSDSMLFYLKQALEKTKGFINQKNPVLARVYNKMGSVYKSRSDFELAESCYTTVLEIRKFHYGEMHEATSAIYNNLGLLYQTFYDEERAIEYLIKSMEIDKELFGKDHNYVAISLSNLANSYKRLGQYEQAIEMLNESLRIRKKLFGEKHWRYVAALNNLSLVYERMKEYEKTFFYQQKIKRLWAEIFPEDHIKQAFIERNIAVTLNLKGDYDKALEYIQSAYRNLLPSFDAADFSVNPDLDELPISENIYEYIDLKGQILLSRYQRDGNPKDLQVSLECTELLFEYVKKFGTRFSNNESKQTYIQDIYRQYEIGLVAAHEFYKLTGEEKYLEKAYEFLEQSKAFVLLENIQNEKARDLANIPTELILKEDSLKRRASELKNEIYAHEKATQKTDTSKLIQLRSDHLELNLALEKIKQSLEQTYPDYFDLKYEDKNIDYVAIRKEMIGPDDLVVEYFIGPTEIFVFGTDAEGLSVYRSEKDSLLQEKVLNLRKLINERSSDIGEFKKIASGLYNDLIGVLDSKLKNKNLVIVPDGILYYLPFELLLSDTQGTEFSGLSYLIKEHQIAYQYSLKVWHETTQKDKGDEVLDLLALAPDFNELVKPGDDLLASNDVVRGSLAPLEGASRELQNIRQIIKGEVLNGVKASEGEFKEKAGQFGIIHLATHAIIDDENPMQSRLLFTQDSTTKEDGDLYSWELYNMKLNAKLAVLSACNTGFGKIHHGEGVMSLGRAFAYAGCPSIVMSLWPAQDAATSDIMTYFYEGLSRGLPKDRALREAKLKYINNSEELFSHPFYWASFVSQGDQEPIAMKRPYQYWKTIMIMAPFIFIIVLLIIRLRSRNKEITSID